MRRIGKQMEMGESAATIPDMRLTKSRDGTNGMALLKIDQPSVFHYSGEVGDITD
ncbi:hypothetical protein Fmac_006204 [Flemingia macrophylla]|uniref:Uncharacterized protein n=1 Tax=Flemingia macrophylla TaxID=520843 RepID=A0ABD1N9W7_9FABA